METRIKQKLIELGVDLTQQIGVAVSGGVDSMVLLHCLRCLDVPLKVYHMEHGIRGQQSLGDMDFVLAHCKSLGIECNVKSANVPMLAKKLGVSVETAARHARYEFLDSAPEKHMATAHHMDDLAETMIMNLVRGSGLNGLCGIPEARGKYIRPMLGISRGEIEEYAKANKIEYVQDATNEDTAYTRNYIRKQILPRLVSINEAAVSNIARTAKLLAEDEQALGDIVASIDCIKTDEHEVSVDIELLDRQSMAVQKRILRQAIGKKFDLVDVENVHIDSILNLMQNCVSGKSINLKYGLVASIAYGKLVIGKNDDKQYNYNLTALPEKGSFKIGSVAFECDVLDSGQKPYYTDETEFFDADEVVHSVFRTRQEGDYIVPLGMSGKKRLSDYLSDRKVPLHKRDRLIVMAKANEVYWVVGVGVSEKSKVTNASSIIKISYQES